jgi:transposase
LEARLFPSVSGKKPRATPVPDFAWMHEELQRHKHVTLQLLWQEYKQANPEGYQYSRFCELYHRWARKLDVVLRQEHRAGEKLFVDHAGQTVPVVDAESGQVEEVTIFVAVLGASNYTYAEATRKRDLPSWIGSHVRALEYLGGVPAVLVPDNTRTGVHSPCRYEPDLNPTYRDFAEHYGTVVIPARVRKPRDKAKVETGVLLVERWILATLRHRTFFGLAQLNESIRELLVKLNNRKFRKLNSTRSRLFEELDRPALKPLPSDPFTYGEWKKARVHIDYHVEVERHYYSVPHSLIHTEIEAWMSAQTVEIFHKGRRVVTHVRSFIEGGQTTLAEHRPKRHQKYLEWTPVRFLAWGESHGPSTAEAVRRILESCKHPEQGHRSCFGLLSLAKRYPQQRLEAACARAVALDACSYKSIKSILETGLDRQPLQPECTPESHKLVHANVRGATYYRSMEVDHAS